MEESEGSFLHYRFNYRGMMEEYRTADGGVKREDNYQSSGPERGQSRAESSLVRSLNISRTLRWCWDEKTRTISIVTLPSRASIKMEYEPLDGLRLNVSTRVSTPAENLDSTNSRIAPRFSNRPTYFYTSFLAIRNDNWRDIQEDKYNDKEITGRIYINFLIVGGDGFSPLCIIREIE